MLKAEHVPQSHIAELDQSLLLLWVQHCIVFFLVEYVEKIGKEKKISLNTLLISIPNLYFFRETVMWVKS